ncbi:GNAT family N-acetyltransferase [Streptomyces sp. TR06-5]|uniref:GNAT family N-acetyltransferase n=1 Tax=Streptomyces sp. TR06-5 TaxID=3385976 RepID=UPI0039A053CF
MRDPAEFEITTASPGEMPLFRDWANAEGWNQGLRDMTAFHAADPRGFFLGRLDGEPVAAVSAVRYGEHHGFLGFYLTRPSARGLGYGTRLRRTALAHLAGRTLALDGVLPQQDSYARSGFRRAWTHVRYEGTVSGGGPAAGVELVDGRLLPFGLTADLDRRFFPAPRDAFLSLWTGLPGHRCLAAVRDGRPDGFAVARPAEHGTRVGPLYAASPDVALSLLNGLATGRHVALDVPDVNAAAVRLVEELGFAATFACARMYAGPVPDVDIDGVFANTTLELG